MARRRAHGFVTAGVVARFHRRGMRRRSLARRRTFATRTRRRRRSARVGALAFEGGGESSCRARIVARDADGRAWRTEIEGAEIAATRCACRTTRPAAVRGRRAYRRPTNGAPWSSTPSPRSTRATLEKVVLARDVDVEADATLRRRDDRSTPCARRSPAASCTPTDGFVGASPELLVRARRTRGHCRARWPAPATTRPRCSRRRRTPTSTGSSSTRSRRRCARCDAVPLEGPAAVALHRRHPPRDDDHAAGLRDPMCRALDLVESLHPTPAVGGSPTQPALAADPHARGHARGRYAGAVRLGRRDRRRRVRRRARAARRSTARTPGCYAGAGIVAGSEPDAEWAETQAKLAHADAAGASVRFVRSSRPRM